MAPHVREPPELVHGPQQQVVAFVLRFGSLGAGGEITQSVVPVTRMLCRLCLSVCVSIYVSMYLSIYHLSVFLSSITIYQLSNYIGS